MGGKAKSPARVGIERHRGLFGTGVMEPVFDDLGGGVVARSRRDALGGSLDLELWALIRQEKFFREQENFFREQKERLRAQKVDSKERLNLREAAEVLGTCQRTVKNWTKLNGLPHKATAGRGGGMELHFSRSAITQWLSSETHTQR